MYTSSPSIQPLAAPVAQAVQPAVLPAGELAATAPAPDSPAAPAAVELDFSALARALDKLAQAPGVNAKLVVQLTNLLKQEGPLLDWLATLNPLGAGGATPPASLPGTLPEPALPPAGELPGALPTQPNSAPGAEAGSAPAPAPTLQTQWAQAVRDLSSTLKSTLPPLPESIAAILAQSEPFPASATPEEMPAPGPAGSMPAAAGGEEKAGLGRSIQQFVQAQVEQVSATLRQLVGRVPDGAATGAGSAAATASVATPDAPPAAMAGGGMGLTSEEAVHQTAAVAEELRALLGDGQPAGGGAPLRTEMIRATLGVVGSLLREPAGADAAARRAAPRPGDSSRGAAPASVAPEQGGEPAAESALPGRLQAVLREVGALRNLLTPAGREVWARIEPQLEELARPAGEAGPVAGARPELAKQPQRLAELARRGISFEVELRESPRLDEAAARLRHDAVPAELERGERSRVATLRVRLPGSQPQEGSAPRETPAAPHASRHEPGKPETPASGTPAPAAKDSPPAKEAFSRMALASSAGSAAPAGTPDERSAAHGRNEAYSHPEAFRAPFQAQQDAAMIQMVAFFHTLRQDVVQGRGFDPSAQPQAGGRVMPENRLLEYKPVEVIRPSAEPASGPAESQARAPVIDIKPVSVARNG